MLVQRLSTIYDVGPVLSQYLFNVLSLMACQYTCIYIMPIDHSLLNKTNIHPMWHYCWASLVDDALTLNQQKTIHFVVKT